MGKQEHALDVTLLSSEAPTASRRAYSVKVATLLVTPLSTSVLFRGTYCCVMILIISCDATPPRKAAVVWSSAPPYRHLEAKNRGEARSKINMIYKKDTLDSHLLDMLLWHTRAKAPFREQLLDAIAQVGNVITADLVHACVWGEGAAEIEVVSQTVRSQRLGIHHQLTWVMPVGFVKTVGSPHQDVKQGRAVWILSGAL
jgi:hypothetical protein